MKQQAETEESKAKRDREEDHKYQVFHTDCSKKYHPKSLMIAKYERIFKIYQRF